MSKNSIIKNTVMGTLFAIAVSLLVEVVPTSAFVCPNNARCVDCFPNNYHNCVICCKNHGRGDACIARCEAAKK